MNTVEEPKVEVEEWDDAEFRHAYLRGNHRVSLCGYDGPSTWRNESKVPSNLCPLCAAILPEYWNPTEGWIK